MSKYTIDDFKADFIALVNKAKGKEVFSTEKVKFTEAKLTDGTTISYEGETPMANMPVFVLDEKGNQIPLADGTYTIEGDGSVLTIVAGVIAEVKGKENETVTPEANVDAPKPAQDMATPVAQPKAVIESIVKESRFTEEVMEAEFKKLTDSIEAVKEELAKQVELNKSLFGLVEKLADVPAESPVVKKANEEVKVTLSKVERMMSEANKLTKVAFK